MFITCFGVHIYQIFIKLNVMLCTQAKVNCYSTVSDKHKSTSNKAKRMS